MSIANTDYVLGELVYYAHRLPQEFTEIKIIPIGDVHFGNPLFSKRHLDQTRDKILSAPNIYTFLTGDLCDTVVRDSVGDVYSAIKKPQDQRDWIIEYLQPLKGRILGMVNGNHERRIYNRVGIDISSDIAKALNIPYRDEGLLTRITFGHVNHGANSQRPNQGYTFFFYITHGYGGARTDGAKAVKVQRTSTYIDADCYIMSHDHTVNVAPDVYLVPDNAARPVDNGFTMGRILAKSKMLVKTNAYVKFGGYSESGGFKPVNLVAPIITCAGDIHGHDHHINKHISVEVFAS